MRMPTDTPRTLRTPWLQVAVFYALACAWSWPFFWWRDYNGESFRALPIPFFLKMSLIMWGPGLSALLCWRLFRGAWPRPTTLTGGHPWRACAFYGVPALALAIPGVTLQPGQPPVHALVPLLGLIGLFNILGEELGWRGFLQDALRPLPPLRRWLLIGLMWTGWHFTNLFAHSEGIELVKYLAWYLPATIALSVLCGSAVLRSRAVLVSVTFHSWVVGLFETPEIGSWIVLGLSIPFWAWLLWTWPQHGTARSAGTRP
jgi:membrane protease YdiL (CAAX protease family)